jgi:hypothetical protein
MIKALSPYWIEIPFVSPNTSLTCTDFALQVFVWNGEKSNLPATPSYEITIKNATSSTGNSRVNISNLIADFIDFTQQEGTTTELIDGNNQNWVSWQTFYTTSNPLDATNPSNINTQLMLRGYSYGMDGENATTPANKILLSGNEFKVNRNGVFVLPIETEQTATPTPELVLTSVVLDSGSDYTYNYTINFDITKRSCEYKQTGSTDWELALITGIGIDEVTATIPLTGSVDFRLSFYDVLSNTQVRSNIITLVI